MPYTRDDKHELIVSSLESMEDSQLKHYEDRITRLYAQYLRGEIHGTIGKRIARLSERLDCTMHPMHILAGASDFVRDMRNVERSF